MKHDPMVPDDTKLYRLGPLRMEQVEDLETLLREGALVVASTRDAAAFVNEQFQEAIEADDTKGLI